jgi:hypothetical protein
MAKWEISDDEFDRQFNEASERTALNFQNEPKIDNAFYNPDKDDVFISLLNGVSIIIPRKLISELSNANKEQLSNLTLTPLKETLAWEELDVYISLKGLIIEYFKLLNWMGPVIARENGKATSEAKAKASRLNGAKGGRPVKSGINKSNSNIVLTSGSGYSKKASVKAKDSQKVSYEPRTKIVAEHQSLSSKTNQENTGFRKRIGRPTGKQIITPHSSKSESTQNYETPKKSKNN